MNLNVNEWKEFRIDKLFNCTLSAGDLKITNCEQGTIPLISSGKNNNGLVGYIDPKGDGKAQIYSGGKLTVDMFCNTFLQDKNFYAVSHGRINILEPLYELNNSILLFLATIINKEQFKYSYGRAVYNDEISRMIVKLPICKNENGEPIIDNSKKYSEEGYIPNFEWMENYIESLKYKPLTTINKGNLNLVHLNSESWKEFRIDKLFKVTGTKTTKIEQLKESGSGFYPYITTSASHNGVEGCYSVFTETGNVLTIDSACIGYCAYQERDFSASDHVEKLIPLFDLNTPRAMFLVTILNKECIYYNYGRKCSQTKLKKRIIKLPICKDESGYPIVDNSYKYSEEGYIPDFEWMENYIKSLPYGDRLLN